MKLAIRSNLSATTVRSLVPLLLAISCGLHAREQAVPRSVAPRGALPAAEQQVIDLFAAAAPSSGSTERKVRVKVIDLVR